MAEFKLGRLRFVWKGAWQTGTSYVKDDVVKYGGTSYVCKSAHIANASFNVDLTHSPSPNWEVMTGGTEWKTAPWTVSTLYKINDLVKYGGNVYIATANHTSSSNASGGFYLDDTANRWDLLVAGTEWKNTWAPSTYYKKSDLVRYNGRTYICTTGHTSTTGSYAGESLVRINIVSAGINYVDGANLTISAPDIPGGVQAVATIQTGGASNEILGITITNYGSGYSTLPTVTASVGTGAVLTATITESFINGLESDQEKWQVFANGFQWRGEWNGSEVPGSRAATSYAVNDIVKFGGSLYLCTIAHTSFVNSFEEGKWATFTKGFEYQSSWSGSTEYQQGDVVKYGGYTYVAKARNTAQVPPTATSYWDLLLAGYNTRNRYDATQNYRVGDVVQYGGNTYVATVEVTPGQTPYSLTSSWLKLTDGFRWLADWTDSPSETKYKIGDIAKYRATSYVCIAEHVPSESPSTLTIIQTIVSGSKIVTSGSTAKLNPQQAIVFTGTGFGGLGTLTTYYIDTIINDSQFTISETKGGSTKTVTAATGILTGTYSSRPDIDDGTFWNTFAEGDANNVLTRRGDIVTRNAIQNIRLPKGPSGTFLKANNTDLEWSTVGKVTRIFYVSTDGVDGADRGTTLNDPWRTVKYACEFLRTVVVPTRSQPAVINVKTGVYLEEFPISVPKYTSLVGDELRMSIIEPTPATSGNNKFYMRDSTTMRNFTFRGATGANLANGLTDTYTVANQYGTKRPTGGAWVSLDPGTGPNDESVWVGERSPYMQNITLFGDYCIGQKIDGSLHNGGNRSLTSNDFTTILSNGIGAWAVGDGRAELVSVFTYYSYIGYLCESGGVLRATNGNNSYGTYGSVSEGVNPTEISRTSNVDNRRLEAIVDRVQTDGENQILYVEYTNAGETYTTATYNFTGTGTFTSVVSTPVIKSGGITEVRTLTSGELYTSVTNNAQAGTNLDIRLGAADIALTNGYVGERILITDGTGSGQYAYITSFDGGTKLATLGMESFTPLTVSATTTSTNRLTVPNTATLSADMPFTLTGTAFGGLATATQYYVKALVGTSTIASVTIAGTAGQFTVTSGTYIVGQTLTISGTKSGTGSISGYADPTTYYIMVGGTSVTSIQITNSYANAIAGVAGVTTGAGTLSGLTYTLGGTQFTMYTDTATKTAITLANGTGSMQLHKSGWDTIVDNITETITAVSKATPASVTTSVPHAYSTGMQVTISSVGGMTQLNGNTYFVTKTGASTFTLYSDSALLTPIDSTGYTTYTSGGTAIGKQYVPLFLNTTSRYVIEPRVVVSTGIGAKATAVQTSGINTITVGNGGGGYTIVPEVIISGDGTGSGGFGALATATIAGSVDAIVVQSKGTGYISAPTLTFVGGGLANNSPDHATATATITSTIKTLEVTNGGTGYTTPPSVTATGSGGSGAILSAQISQVVNSVTMTGGSNSGGSGYTSPPTVSFSGGEPIVFAQGIANLNASVVSITVQEGGSGYAPLTTSISFSSIIGNGATATAVIDGGNYVAGVTPGVITSITVDTGGSLYASAPSVVITGAGVAASATANINGSVASVTITTRGRGYKTTPTVTFAGGGGAGARGTVTLTGSVYSVSVVDGGRGWTTTSPSIGFSGGGGSSAAATVTAMDSVLDTITIDTPGSGYTSNPAISLTGGSLVYDQEKCSRDVGLMIDAVTSDMVFGSNYQSVNAGRAYLRAYSNVVIDSQKTQTVASINKTRDLALAKTTDATAISRITTLFGHITTIINGGLVASPTLNYPNPSNVGTNITGGAAIIRANYQFIKDELAAWIAVQIAGGAGVWAGYSYNAATFIDFGFIVDALQFDLLYGGNTQTIETANSYYNPAGSITVDQSQTILAMGRLKTILAQIVVNSSITKSSGNASNQNISISPMGNSATATAISDLADIVTNILQNGTSSAPTAIDPSFINGNSSLATIRTLIRASTSTIQTAVIDFISANFIGGGGVLRSRINGIVQTVTVTDPGGSFSSTPLITFAYGNQFKSAVAGRRYYANASARLAIGLSQGIQTLAAINQLRLTARAVAQNAAPATVYQSAIGRTTGTAGPVGIQNAVDVWVNAVYYTIQNGTGYVNAPLLIRTNRAFIRAEAMAFWAANYPGIATATWSRDVGLLLDAVCSDLSDEGVDRVLTAGIKAIFLSTARTTDLATATAGIDFVRDLCVNLIQNIVVTPLTGLTITNSTAVTNVYTTASVSSLTVGDQVLFTGTVFGGISANVMYYVVAVNSGANTFQVSLTNGGTPVTLSTTSGTMTLSKQFINQTVTLESLALTAVPNLFNYAKSIISTTVADSSTFAAVASVINNNKNFIRAEVIAFINTTYIDFDYNQVLCARDAGLIVDALVYDLQYAVANMPTTTSSTTGVVSSITVNSGGTGYGAGTTVTITGGGTPTTTATATPIYDAGSGVITGFTMTNKGRGYSSVPTVTIVPDSGSGALIRARIVGGLINAMTIIQPGSGYTAGPNLTLIDPNNTSDASFYVRTGTGVLGQPRFTGRGVGFTNADCEIAGDGYADIAQVGQYVYVNSLTNIPTPGANIQFASNPNQYYKLVTVRNVTGPDGLIGARQLITDNKEFIQYEIISYLNNFTYNSTKCSRDVGLIIDAIADDFTYGGNARLQAMLYQHQRGTFALFEQQRMQTAFALEELQRLLNVQFSEQESGLNVISNKLNFVIEWIKNKEYFQAIPALSMPSGLFDTQDDRAKIVLLANETFVRSQVVNWMINQSKITGFNQTLFSTEIRQILRSIAYDLTYTGNTQTVEFASSYFIDGALTIPGVPGTSAAAKSDFLTMITFMSTLLQDIAINSNVTPQAGNTAVQNTSLTPGDAASQTRIQTLMTNFSAIINSGFASSGVSITASNFTGFITNRRTAVLANKSTLQAAIITWMDNNFVNFTYDSDVCFRDVGLIVQAISDDIYGDVAKSVEAGQRYQAATASLVISEQKPQTIAAIQQINYIVQLLITNQTYTRTQTNAFQVRYPAITTGSDAAEHLHDTIRIVRDIVENGAEYNAIKQVLLDNKEYIKAEVVAYVSASYENLDYSVELCARDTGLIVDAICYDIFGGVSRSQEAGLRYYQSASALKAITGDQLAPTIAAMNYINSLIQAVLTDSDPAIKFQEVIGRTPNSSIVYPASKLLVGTKVATCITTILGVINNGPSSLPEGRYSARLQVSPPLTIATAPPHATNMVIRSKYSQVRLTGHDFLNIGTGSKNDTNYPGIPLNAPQQSQEITEQGGGRVFYTSTDQDGNFRVGSLFKVEQSTGIATLNADAFNLSGLNELTLGGVSLGSGGATINEFSTDGTFFANSDRIVPTQKAIKTYIQSALGSGGGNIAVNAVTAGDVFITGREIDTVGGGQLSMISAAGVTITSTTSSATSTTGALTVAGGVGIAQNLNVGGVTSLTGNLTVTSTGFVKIATGATADRTGFTAAAGMLRFNTTIAQFEGYNGTSWGLVGAGNPWTAKTANYTAVNADRLLMNTSASPLTLTLPLSPALGDTIRVVDAAGTFNLNNLTIARNGQPIMGDAQDLTVSSLNAAFSLVYYNSTYGWRLGEA